MSNEAKISDVEYASLQEALNVGGVVELISDVTLTAAVTIPDGKEVTLVGGDFTVTSPKSVIAVGSNAKLTVESGKFVSTGNVCIGPVKNAENAEITVNGGTFESVEGAVITSISKNTKITINDGTFSASDNAVFASNGTAGYGPGTLIVNGGTFNGAITTPEYVACGIYWPMSGSVTVNGGTFNITNGCGILSRAGTAEINGGTFNTTGTAVGKVGDSRVVVPCAAVVFDTKANYPSMTTESKIDVKGGTLNSEVATIQTVGDDAIVTVDAANVTGATAKNGYVFNKSGKLVAVDSAEDDTDEPTADPSGDSGTTPPATEPEETTPTTPTQPSEEEQPTETPTASEAPQVGGAYSFYTQQQVAAALRRQREMQQYAYAMRNRV